MTKGITGGQVNQDLNARDLNSKSVYVFQTQPRLPSDIFVRMILSRSASKFVDKLLVKLQAVKKKEQDQIPEGGDRERNQCCDAHHP